MVVVFFFTLPTTVFRFDNIFFPRHVQVHKLQYRSHDISKNTLDTSPVLYGLTHITVGHSHDRCTYTGSLVPFSSNLRDRKENKNQTNCTCRKFESSRKSH